MSETYVLHEILEAIQHGNRLAERQLLLSKQILEVEQASMGFLSQIEKNTNPPSPRTTSIGNQFSTPKESHHE